MPLKDPKKRKEYRKEYEQRKEVKERKRKYNQNEERKEQARQRTARWIKNHPDINKWRRESYWKNHAARRASAKKSWIYFNN